VSTLPTWRPGDPLPQDGLWTQAMVAQYAQVSLRTVQRLPIRRADAPGAKYDPADVRAFFSRELRRAG
jgi:hypothetical protein